MPGPAGAYARTKTTGLDVALTLLQHNVWNVFIIIGVLYSQVKIMSTNSVLQHQTCKNREQQACDLAFNNLHESAEYAKIYMMCTHESSRCLNCLFAITNRLSDMHTDRQPLLCSSAREKLAGMVCKTCTSCLLSSRGGGGMVYVLHCCHFLVLCTGTTSVSLMVSSD